MQGAVTRGLPIHILARSDVDKTRSLLEGIQKEVELDGQHPTPEQDIAIRLD